MLAVYEVPDFAESKYGFHFKDTGEFGLYAWFYDDKNDKTYELTIRDKTSWRDLRRS